MLNRKRESWNFPIPHDSLLLGIDLHFQALDLTIGSPLPPRLTQLRRTSIVK